MLHCRSSGVPKDLVIHFSFNSNQTCDTQVDFTFTDDLGSMSVTNRTVHDNHKRTPTATTTTIMSGSEKIKTHYSHRRKAAAAAAGPAAAAGAEIPSPPPTLTSDHHHIHLTNQCDGRSGEEERDLLIFEHQLRKGETVRAAGLQLEQMEFNYYLEIMEMETRARLREREMGLRERQWRLRAQKIVFFSFLALFGAYILVLFLRLQAYNYIAGGEGVG
ncbi:hypothetical protein BCON_0011g00530 [Botryotinia convoluta]|uniref:Uncharacterized protein n=1 Tax=Botryotinia convoluta TaxID=54673 RepID=A0A4Z1IQE3_9HELO|nr:hypothetical protein BCON_0011g00530 [Botryotinia convoluta]